MGEENDPLFLSPEESDRLDMLMNQFSRPQALQKVLKGERYRRFVAAEARAAMEKSAAEAKQQREEREASAQQKSADELIELMKSTYPSDAGDTAVSTEAPPTDTSGDQ